MGLKERFWYWQNPAVEFVDCQSRRGGCGGGIDGGRLKDECEEIQICWLSKHKIL
jgi:hypothetical protein